MRPNVVLILADERDVACGRKRDAHRPARGPRRRGEGHEGRLLSLPRVILRSLSARTYHGIDASAGHTGFRCASSSASTEAGLDGQRGRASLGGARALITDVEAVTTDDCRSGPTRNRP